MIMLHYFLRVNPHVTRSQLEHVLKLTVDSGERFTMQTLVEQWFSEGKAEGEAEGEAKGIAKGEAKGIAKGKAEVALKMLQAGLPLEQIVSLTGLSREEIERLRFSESTSPT
jgi:predicted transposase/invertase (TIGR01784 family)